MEFLLLKKQLKKNADTQCLEDVICLVFLNHYLEPFIQKHEDEKVNSILKSENLLSIETIYQYPGLLVGLGISLISTTIVTLLIIYQVYYHTLKKVNIAQKELKG